MGGARCWCCLGRRRVARDRPIGPVGELLLTEWSVVGIHPFLVGVYFLAPLERCREVRGENRTDHRRPHGLGRGALCVGGLGSANPIQFARSVFRGRFCACDIPSDRELHRTGADGRRLWGALGSVLHKRSAAQHLRSALWSVSSAGKRRALFRSRSCVGAVGRDSTSANRLWAARGGVWNCAGSLWRSADIHSAARFSAGARSL